MGPGNRNRKQREIGQTEEANRQELEGDRDRNRRERKGIGTGNREDRTGKRRGIETGKWEIQYNMETERDRNRKMGNINWKRKG